MNDAVGDYPKDTKWPENTALCRRGWPRFAKVLLWQCPFRAIEICISLEFANSIMNSGVSCRSMLTPMDRTFQSWITPVTSVVVLFLLTPAPSGGGVEGCSQLDWLAVHRLEQANLRSAAKGYPFQRG